MNLSHICVLSVPQAMDTKLQDEVYTPIERWHKQYQQLKVWNPASASDHLLARCCAGSPQAPVAPVSGHLSHCWCLCCFSFALLSTAIKREPAFQSCRTAVPALHIMIRLCCAAADTHHGGGEHARGV